MKKFSIILIICLLIAFISTILYTKNSVKVLKVYSPSQIALDLNKNGKVEVNEKFTVDGIETFTSKVSDYQKSIAEYLGIDESTALSIGYFAEKYAQNLLEEKSVIYKKLGNNNITVNFNGKNYNQIVQNSPFALKNKEPINKKEFEKQIKLAKTYNLRIYNNKSNKYHYLNCQYGQIAGDSIILPKNQLPKNSQECKFCKEQVSISSTQLANEKNIKEQKIINTIKSKEFNYKQEKIKLILTDLTTVFKPSKNCTSEFCMTLVKQINNSNQSIDMALYGYTNIPEITMALQNAIRRGVRVRLIYDIDSKNSNFYPDTINFAITLNDSIADYGNTKYQTAIMHNKFFIFDKKFVLTGSANISETDIAGFSSNAIVLIESEEIANIYENEFNQMYSGKFHNKKTETKNNENILLGDSIISVYFSPQDNFINTKLIPLINNANKYVYLPIFLITHKKLIPALVDAHLRNVDIKVIIDGTNASNEHSMHEVLRQNGIPVKTENYAGKMHSKTIIIDDKYLVLGSMNLSKSGNDINDENIIVLENPALTKQYKEFFLYLWNKIPEIWLTKNALGESHDSLGSCFDGIDNDFDDKIDLEDSGCKPITNN